MRLMKIDTATYSLYRPAAAATGYVGTKNEYASAGTIDGHLSPASDRFSIEMFGDKAAATYTLFVDVSTDIRKNDRVTLGDGDYTVISVMVYQTHKTATLEKAVALYGS